MKKLILPLLFIFLAAAAFGQTKKDMPKIQIHPEKFVQVPQVKLAPESVEHFKAALEKAPSLAKYWKIDQKTLKPKAGYGFMSNGKGRVVTCRTGANGKPKLEKAYVKTFYLNTGSMETHICKCKEEVEKDPCWVVNNPATGKPTCGAIGGGCTCKYYKIVTDSNGVTTVVKRSN